MKEKMNTVTIDVVKRTINEATQEIDEEVTEVFNGRKGGSSAVVSVLKAYEEVRAKVKDNIKNVEVGVNGSKFQG